MTEVLEVGSTVFRPFEGNKGWSIMDPELPLEVVKAYVLTRCPLANVTGYENHTAEHVFAPDSTVYWLDKKAVVVSCTASYALAIVLHDGVYMLLKKTL